VLGAIGYGNVSWRGPNLRKRCTPPPPHWIMTCSDRPSQELLAMVGWARARFHNAAFRLPYAYRPPVRAVRQGVMAVRPRKKRARGYSFGGQSRSTHPLPALPRNRKLRGHRTGGTSLGGHGECATKQSQRPPALRRPACRVIGTSTSATAVSDPRRTGSAAPPFGPHHPDAALLSGEGASEVGDARHRDESAAACRDLALPRRPRRPTILGIARH